MLGREGVEGEDVVLGAFQQRGELGQPPFELGDCLAVARACLLERAGA